jgi:hypothetical protein
LRSFPVGSGIFYMTLSRGVGIIGSGPAISARSRMRIYGDDFCDFYEWIWL